MLLLENRFLGFQSLKEEGRRILNSVYAFELVIHGTIDCALLLMILLVNLLLMA